MPDSTVSNGTPLSVCACGSKKISAWRTFWDETFLQVCPGQVMEVPLVQEYLHAPVVDIQKGLEVAEVVGSTRLFDGGVRERDIVAFGDLEHQLRL